MMAKSHRRKQKLFQTTQATTKLYTRLVWGAPLLSRLILRGAVSLTLRTQIGRPEGPSYSETTIYCISNTTEHILTKFGVLCSCMDSA